MNGIAKALLSALLPVTLASVSVSQETPRTVRTRVQPRPGAQPEDFDMPIHAVPLDPPLVDAAGVKLADGELVLGLARGEQALAVPIRTLSSFEVLNTQLADLPVAPTW